jgi:hypothetical protein
MAPGPAGVCPDAKRPRNAWFLRVTKILGTAQLEIGYKSTRGDESPFSNSKPGTAAKVPFGPPVKCEYSRKKVGDDDVGEFKFTNKRRETALFRESVLNNFNVSNGVNILSKRITSLVVDKKQKLLALFLSLLPHTSGFVHHREEFHDENGFSLDGSGIQEGDLINNGGTLKQFLELVDAALKSAVVVDAEVMQNNPISNFFQVGQKRSQDNSSQSKKKSKVQIRTENEDKEIEDETGLEKEYQRSYLGLAEIPLENISVAPELKSQINIIRVHTVVGSMRKYDPSLSVLVVCPEDFNNPVDLTDVKNVKFHCIQKIHTLEAFHQLDKDGKFTKLTGHSMRTVICYVIKTNSSGLVHYGHLRPTSIETQFLKKIFPQHILHIFHSLSSDGSVNSRKVVERIARLCRIGANEATAISKLCKWSKEAFSALIEVIELFEKYETLDVKPSGHQGRLARGEKLPMTNKLFILLNIVCICPILVNRPCV